MHLLSCFTLSARMFAYFDWPGNSQRNYYKIAIHFQVIYDRPHCCMTKVFEWIIRFNRNGIFSWKRLNTTKNSLPNSIHMRSICRVSTQYPFCCAIVTKMIIKRQLEKPKSIRTINRRIRSHHIMATYTNTFHKCKLNGLIFLLIDPC